MDKNKIKTLIIIGWILVIVAAILIFRANRVPLLEDELLDPIVDFQDQNIYNIKFNTYISEKFSPLFSCRNDISFEYLDTVAQKINEDSRRIENGRYISWYANENELMTYDLETTIININLTQQDERVPFRSVSSFLAEYFDFEIKYYELIEQEDGETKVYLGNRLIEDMELNTTYKYSDFYYVENGYLVNARILLANFEKSKYFVPLIQDMVLLERYLENPNYPKRIILDTASLLEVDEQSYESVDIEIEYDKCVVNDIDTKLYFSSCQNNYIYYVYEIAGICDVIFEKEIYTVPFSGFINAIDPKYVKTFY